MEKVFFDNGLNFTCTQCHNCCRHESGYVFLSEEDIEKLASYFDMDEQAFLNKYCTIVDLTLEKRYSLTEKTNYDCIFWDNGCTVYQARPLQCRAYPFWPQNIVSIKTWNALKKECPGVDQGSLHEKERIMDWLSQRRTAGFANPNTYPRDKQ